MTMMKQPLFVGIFLLCTSATAFQASSPCSAIHRRTVLGASSVRNGESDDVMDKFERARARFKQQTATPEQVNNRPDVMSQYGPGPVNGNDGFVRNYQEQRTGLRADRNDDALSPYGRGGLSSESNFERNYWSQARQQQQMQKAETKYGFWQNIASFQSFVTGAVSGGVGIAPILALHHFVWLPVYESLAQFEYDLGTSMLEGALFALVYRYALRTDLDSTRLKNNVLMVLVAVRSFVQVQVPMSCTPGFPMMCGEPLEVMDWSMLQQLSLAGAESLALFATVAGTMEFLLKRSWIRQFSD